jgi:hypothetical protein
MYSSLQKIHLWCAFFLAIFLGMYFITGYVLTHQPWFGNPDPVKVTRFTELDFSSMPKSPNESSFAAILQNWLKIRGKAEPARQHKDGQWEFQFHHPGSLTTVILAADLRRATITEEHHSWQRTLIGFHRLHGYGGGILYDLWAVVYDLVSVATILFALTGIYLWYKHSKNRTWGWMLLCAGFAFTITTFLYLLVGN